MRALTIRLPDDKYKRLKALSKRRGTSVNRLIDEMATLLLAEFDAEARFQMRAERGRGKSARGVALLRKARAPSTKHRVGPFIAAPARHRPQPGVEATLLEQLAMRVAFDDAALLHRDDGVGVAYCGQPVRYDDDGATRLG